MNKNIGWLWRMLTVLIVCFMVRREAHAVTISYTAVNLPDTTPGEDLWQYQYHVRDGSFLTGFGFEVLFPLADGFTTGDLKNTPAPNADWDTIAQQPDPSGGVNGRYNALALVDNASLADVFLVDFVWRGTGVPESQIFELFDDSFQVVDEGFTTATPEPSTLFLLGTSLVLFGRLMAWKPR